jgi:L-lactate permease
MQAWPHVYDPLGSLWLSSLIATIPIMFFLRDLVPQRLKSNDAVTLTVAPEFLSFKHALKK